MNRKTCVRQLAGWVAAAAVALLLCNFALYAYHRPAAWVDRRDAATNAVLRPGAVTRMGTEGYGTHNVDSRGYLNPELPLEESYTLVMGSSFVQGKEVAAGKRFVDLMNNALAESPNALAVYSVSQDGFYFPEMARSFSAMLEELPHAHTVILETNLADFTAKELEKALQPHALDSSQTGEALMASASTLDRLIMAVKETFPILNLGKVQLTAMLGSSESGSEVPEPATPEQLHAVMAQLRQAFDGTLIVYYHPDVTITAEGTLEAVPEAGVAELKAACEANDIRFVDATQAFLEAYRQDYTVPYGFANTTIGGGHLNEDGHRITAQLLLEAMEGGGAS